jgi:putative serine protease PepD
MTRGSRDRPRPGHGLVMAALVAGMIGGGGAAGSLALLSGGFSGNPGVALTQAAGSAPAGAVTPGSVASAAATAMPSTVDVQVDLGNGSGEGSGVVLTADGNVLTNNHVVAGAQGTITVTLADGSEHSAAVVGTSPSYDLAVIKMQGVSGLTPARLGRSAGLQVGQPVVAIGSPQGLTGTVTGGIVSALDRTVAVSDGASGAAVVYNGLQTDAPINPGNSGGPLVDLSGHVIGIDSAIATAGSGGAGSGQSGSIGLGFAIPIDQATRVAREILDSGHATKPVLGVAGRVTGRNGGAATTTPSGAQIDTVTAGSPAAAAGLQPGDLVTKVGAARVGSFDDLVARIGASVPGSAVTLTIARGGATTTAQVTLGSQTDTAASTGSGGPSPGGFGGN